jgi:hypothetical protein
LLHGALVGIAAILLYTALTFRLMMNGQLPMGVSFFAAHLVKVLGGAAGGFVAERRG